MRDGLLFRQGEHIPVRTKEFHTIPADKFELYREKLARIYHIQAHQIGHSKAVEADAFRNEKEPQLHFEAVSTIRKTILSDKNTQKRLERFVKAKLFPFIEEHQDIYLKNVEGGGGGAIARLRLEEGHLIVESTNPHLINGLGQLAPVAAVSSINGPKSRRLWTFSRQQLTGLYDESRFGPVDLDHAIDLGPIKELGTSFKRAMSNLFFHTLMEAETSRNQGLVAEKTIPHLTTEDGHPVELRCILQRMQDGKYRVTHHYVKVGGHPLAANVGQGGSIQQTMAVLTDLLQKAHPNKKSKTIKRMADQFVAKAVQNAESYMNHHIFYWLPTAVIDSEDPKRPNEYGVLTAPILSTFDYLVRLNQQHVKPFAVEHHAEGNFGLLDDVRQGIIPTKKWDWMRRIHQANVERIYSEISKQPPIPKKEWDFFAWWAEHNEKRDND